MVELSFMQQRRLELAKRGDRLSQFWLAPWKAMESPDQWQKEAMRRMVTLEQNCIINCTRGAGKSEVVSHAAYVVGAMGGRVVIFSRSDRQAKEEVFDRIVLAHRRLKLEPHVGNVTSHDIKFRNGGRILSLPCSEKTVVGKHKIAMLVIDEAALVTDRFYARVTPMISTCAGKIVLLSTPFGKRGFFYREWIGKGRQDWARFGPVTWEQCPRITREHVEAERRSHGDWWVEQEYECKFKAEVGSFFGDIVDNIDSMTDPYMRMTY